MLGKLCSFTAICLYCSTGAHSLKRCLSWPMQYRRSTEAGVTVLTVFVLHYALHSRVVLDAAGGHAALQRAQEAPSIHPSKLVWRTLTLVQDDRPQHLAILSAQLYPAHSKTQ